MRQDLLIIRDNLITEIGFFNNISMLSKAKGTLIISVKDDMGFKINEVERQEILNSIYQYSYIKETDHFDLKNIKIIIRL